MSGSTIYMLAGGRERSDWVRNIFRKPEVTVRITDRVFEGHGRIVNEAAEHELARTLAPREVLADVLRRPEDWGRTALPVAIDLQ